MSGGGPKYNSANTKRSSKIVYVKDILEKEKIRRMNRKKYPKCIGEEFFKDCPKEVKDIKNPPSECKTCSQYTPSASVMKERFLKLQEELKDS